MKKPRKVFVLLFLFFSLLFIQDMGIEAKEEDIINNIKFLPQAMDVVPRWSTQVTGIGEILSSPAVGDIDNDGQIEIIQATMEFGSGYIKCLNQLLQQSNLFDRQQ